MDGATPWQLFYRILLPLMRPILVVLFVISFTAFYNEVLLATTLLSGTEQYTYAVGLSLFTTSDYTAKWGLIGAAAVVGALPIVAMSWPYRTRSSVGSPREQSRGSRRRTADGRLPVGATTPVLLDISTCSFNTGQCSGGLNVRTR